MSGLRAHWTMSAAGVMLAGTVFSFGGGTTRAAQILDIPESQQTAPEDDTTPKGPTVSPLFSDELAAEPVMEVAQFPPPPFYMGPTYSSPSQPRWRWPWESDNPAQSRSRHEARPPHELRHNELQQYEHRQIVRKRRWREQNGEGVAERQQREPSEPMGTHVFEAVSAGADGKLRWMVVSPTGNEGVEERSSRYRRRAVVEEAPVPSPTRAATAALDRIGLPQAAIDRIDDIVSVGSTLIVSDQGLGRTAVVPDTDFSVVLR